MSRIEQAMEKASQLRRDYPPAVTDGTGYAQQGGDSGRHNRLERHEPAVPVSSDNPLLVNLTQPFSAAAEEFRKVKAMLLSKTKENGFHNTIMVTSALPGEGKTMACLNLAVSLAEEFDHTVLLVEADLRRPTMHTFLTLEEKPGFSDCLLGEADLAEAIMPTGIGKLSIIRAGHSVPNPSELFSSQQTKNLVAEMKNRYPDRYIIFDTPPILPFSEARSLGKLVDTTVFVVMERHASLQEIQESLDVLKGCPVLGMIYNNAEQVGHDKRYGYSQRYMQEHQAL